MADSRGAFWRLLPSVRASERECFLFFVSIAVLISFGQTLGLAGAEALFLARFGVEYLPHTFIVASVVTVMGMLLYAALVGSVHNDKMLAHMLYAATLVLGGATFGATAGVELVLPGLLVIYFLTQAVFLNHFWTFANDYFDILASKRLVPLFALGASAGGFLGGAVAVGITRIARPETLIAGWALLLMICGILIQLRRRDLLRWGLVELVEQDETSLESLYSAMRYMTRSRMARWLVFSAIGMVLALFVSQYLYSQIFVEVFPNARELASFFGIYLALSNLGEILLVFAVTPWLIRRLGVAMANLVHPLFTVLSFVGLAIDPRLYTAVLARMNREMLDEAMSANIRSLTYNAIAQRFRGRTRAFVEGIVIYSAMSLVGIVLLLNKDLDRTWLCTAGGAMGLLYLFTNLRIRQEYLNTLVGGVREGRLDLADLTDQLDSWEASRLTELWNSVVEQGGPQLRRNARQLAPILAANGLTELLVRATADNDHEVRRACLEALGETPSGVPESVLLKAVEDPDPAVRRATVEALVRRMERAAAAPADGGAEAPGEARPGARRRPQEVEPAPGHSFGPQLQSLLGDEDARVRAEAALAMGRAGRSVLAEMARSEEVETAVAALRCLPPELAELARERAADPDPEIRATALESVARLASSVSIGGDRLLADLDHADSRVRGAAVTALAATAATRAEAVEAVASALADPSREVRMRAVHALVDLGEDGLRAAAPYMKWESEGTALAAIEVLSACPAASSRRLFASELKRRVHQAWGDLLSLQVLPKHGNLSTRFLRAAHTDSLERNQRLSFAILCGLEDPNVVRSVERALRLGSPRARADALEVLSNLGEREAANLLVVMLEDSSIEDKVRAAAGVVGSLSNLDEAVDADRRALDVWIRMGSEYFRKEGEADISQRDTMERLLLLREVPLFSRLSLEQLEAINRVMTESYYVWNEVVFREGDPAGDLYLLLQGKVRVVTGHGTPDELILNELVAPSYFGEMAILDDQPRSGTVVVSEDARLLSLNGESFKDLMLQMPEISFEICRQLTSRLRAQDSRRRRSTRKDGEDERTSTTI